ncbi:YbxH family protein [Bacillus sp. DNRA2]|uniref:YbxH family protein n=1 Tax=Bacillus sp. DNRA2 TaxID=2723053 RepID=UPI00145E4065|nr:YbxH family protein [Bacillus sp. DNRA2]NMD70378.1 YbxH family protein [Bacillus sp. DNRA2]
MGAIERNDYRFEPEYSVIAQNGAIHVYHQGDFIDELKFTFNGKFPELDEIEKIVDKYCEEHGI